MKLKCIICSYETDNKQSFNSHITHGHHITSKEYYDIYLKQDGDGICSTCGKQTRFRNMWYGYNKHCCTKCIPLNEKIQEQMKLTCMQKYGTEYAFQAEEVKQKIKNTTYKHYGVNCYLQTAQNREIVVKIITSDKVKQKIKETNIKNLGVEYSFKSTKVKEKIKQTKLKRYGNENYNNSEKAKQTCIQKYGVDNQFKRKEIREKCNSTEARQKANITLRKNNKCSSLELYLENIFNNFKIQYISQYNKDERYPYHCDFYLPNIDTFVEINGYWMHNGHWFDKNNQTDINKLNDLINKINICSAYKKAISVWTKSDVEKRNCAKENKLNYVVLWNKKDIDNWINSNFEIRHDY